MGDIVNLNKARKARAKEDAAARTAENRIRFGRPKAQSVKALKEARQAAGALDGKRLDEPR
jgi:hypothetical protein